jgi:hypothetical protein
MILRNTSTDQQKKQNGGQHQTLKSSEAMTYTDQSTAPG